MRRQRIKLAIQTMMVATALVALNLGAAIAVSRTRPRERVLASRDAAHFQGPRIKELFLDALTCRLSESPPSGAVFEGIERVVQEPLPETPLQIWSPVIASASITILVLALSFAKLLALRPRAGDFDQALTAPRWGWWHLGTIATIAIALIGLNFAAVTYRPPLDASGPELARRYLNSSGVFLIEADGSSEYLGRHRDLVLARSRDAVPTEPDYVSLPVSGRTERDIVKVTTIEHKDDGSVLAHGGRLGEVTSNPIVLRRPLRSPLEMWWTLIASTSITVLVVVLWRRTRQNWAEGSEAQVSRHSRRWTCARSVTGWAVIGATLVAINGGGALATWNAYMRVPISRVRLVERAFWRPSLWDEETWDIRFGFGGLATGEELIRIMSLPGRPTLVQLGAPVIATASITLLVLIVLLGCMGSRRRYGAPNSAGDLVARPSPIRLVRWAATAGGLIGLNVAGAAYGPFPEPGGEQPCPAAFQDPAMVPDQRDGLLSRDRANRVVKGLPNGGSERYATAADFPLPLHGYDGYTHRGGARVKDTVVYRSDGSVVAYAGNPGFLERQMTRPHVIRPPTRSFLEVWWAVIGSVSISLVIIGILWRMSRWPGSDSTSEDNARVDLAARPREVFEGAT